MKNRRVKCQYKSCGKYEIYPQTEMYVETNNAEGKKPKYFHFNCFEKEKILREFKQIEAKELSDLVDTIKIIHNMDNVNSKFFSFLQDLRNGTIRGVKGFQKKSFKEGVKYPIIKRAYELSKKQIQFAKRTKHFKDDLSELKYCFMIIQGKVGIAKREFEKEEQLENTYVNPHHSYSEFNVEPVKKFPKK